MPGGGTTLGNPCNTLGPLCAAGLTITLPADALLPPVTIPLILPVSPGVNGGWLPVPSVLPSPEESRLREKRFGLKLRLATLLVTYCCKELKKLILFKSATGPLIKMTNKSSDLLVWPLRNRPYSHYQYITNEVHFVNPTSALSTHCPVCFLFFNNVFFPFQRFAQQLTEDRNSKVTIGKVHFYITSVNKLLARRDIRTNPQT